MSMHEDKTHKGDGARIYILFSITIVLAFSSIVYELLLAQSLSAFLGNTILQYSTTIGIYMFSMGIGAFIAEGKIAKNPLVTLLSIEILLSILGGSSLVLLYLFYFLNNPFIFLIGAYILIGVIGLLTGAEIPLLIETYRKQRPEKDHVVLGIDYIGALLGTLLFAFIFYREIGLMGTAFFVGFLNSLAGCLLITQKVTLKKTRIFSILIATSAALSIVLCALFLFREQINDYFLNIYLG